MAQPGAGEDVYCTLLLNDNYLPGALVLAHSLRDGGTTKKLGILITADSVAVDAVTQLREVYDYVIPVPRIRNPAPENLSLMNRTDLHSAFTKINLWKLTEFRKVVYIDADVVAYRAPDELFDVEQPFSAAPDIGWPDLFNTGVMVLTPNMSDYEALMAMAERGISFDGADQGLLNMHFKDKFNRLSFTYNVTPSAHYQYVPAFRHFQSTINMVHFIGQNKPWFRGRQSSTGNAVFDEMMGRWWAVYDRHYQAASTRQGFPNFGNNPNGPPPMQIHSPSASPSHFPSQNPSSHDAQFQSDAAAQVAPDPNTGIETEACEDQGLHTSMRFSEWDAQRHSPPINSKPEAPNFPTVVYTMSKDATPFVAPDRYPSPPRNMGYEVPRGSPAGPRPIFPWEGHQPQPSRVFADPIPAPQSHQEDQTKITSTSPDDLDTESSTTGHSSIKDPLSEPVTPTTPTIRTTAADPWTSFTQTNAWDDVPEIERYVENLQKHRRSQSQKGAAAMGVPSPTSSQPQDNAFPNHGSKLTDFPSEAERPSLPVTPAPVHPSKFWDSGSDGPGNVSHDPLLPAAEGVPGQDEWDPVASLQKLANQQSEMLQKLSRSDEQGLGAVNTGVGGEVPTRSVPFGSEGLISPTYVARLAKMASPQPVKGNTKSRLIQEFGHDEGESHDDDRTPRPRSPTEVASTAPAPAVIAQPSYTGPGAIFEKGEIAYSR